MLLIKRIIAVKDPMQLNLIRYRIYCLIDILQVKILGRSIMLVNICFHWILRMLESIIAIVLKTSSELKIRGQD